MDDYGARLQSAGRRHLNVSTRDPFELHSAPADRCDSAAPAPAHASAAANSDRHVGGTPARRKLPGWRRTKRPVSTRRLIALGPSPAVSASCAPTTPKCSAATRSQARSASDIGATSHAVDDDDVAPATPVHAPPTFGPERTIGDRLGPKVGGGAGCGEAADGIVCERIHKLPGRVVSVDSHVPKPSATCPPRALRWG